MFKVAGCILGVQKVYAEETTTNTIAVNQSTTEVGVSNLTTIPATRNGIRYHTLDGDNGTRKFRHFF